MCLRVRKLVLILMSIICIHFASKLFFSYRLHSVQQISNGNQIFKSMSPWYQSDITFFVGGTKRNAGLVTDFHITFNSYICAIFLQYTYCNALSLWIIYALAIILFRYISGDWHTHIYICSAIKAWRYGHFSRTTEIIMWQ